MPWLEAVRLALRTIRAQKLKSFFSLIGVLIGVTFLIAVVSIVTGMNRYMEEKFANALIGLNTFQLRQRPNFTSGNVTDDMWREWSRRPRISYGDAAYIKAHVRTPVTYANFCSDRVAVSYAGKTAKDIELIGTEPTYFDIKDYKLTAGRPFAAQEMQLGLPVLVLGSELAEKLFNGVDPIGKDATMYGLPYRVIGVVERQGTLFGISLDKFAIMPFTAPARRFICPINVLDHLIVQASGPGTMTVAMGEVEASMRTRRQLKPGQENNFFLQTSEAALEGWQKISKILITALPLLVSISLIVGGIVIMNIMLASFRERIREVGIRKATGAKGTDIAAQFLVESILVTGLGGALGLVGGVGLAKGITFLLDRPAIITPTMALVGVVSSVSVGLIFGLYPAIKAARLNPVDALRYE